MNKILIGIKLFNNADYFSAHDFFEEEWRSCNSSDKLFFQGLTQISVGSFHFASGNFSGSLSQYKKALDKLEKYLPSYKNVDIQNIVLEFNAVVEELQSYFSKEIDSLKGVQLPTIKILN